MKSAASDLAILGGQPAFAEPLHVGRPNIGDRARLMSRIDDILDRKWLTNRGPQLLEFEQRVAALLGVRHCIAVCNATVGLEIAIRAVGMQGEVIVPSYTFVATAHALQWQQIKPVFCDVDPRTHNLDPAEVERSITPRTTGILGVHVWGRPCAIDALESIATRHDLKLIFDAAHAFGCSYQGQMIGRFGLAEVFSFHATKFLNTLEGGAVVTNDDALAERLRLMQNFGFRGYDNVVYLGTNGKMCEIAAAMGIVSLDAMDQFIATNRENYECYRREAEELPGIRIIDYDRAEKNNYQYVVAEVDETRTNLSRDELISVLHAENILARRYFWPGCHQMMPYRALYPDAASRLPHTEQMSARVLVLPTGTSLGADEIHRIGNILKTAMAHAATVRGAVRARAA